MKAFRFKLQLHAVPITVPHPDNANLDKLLGRLLTVDNGHSAKCKFSRTSFLMSQFHERFAIDCDNPRV